MTNIVYYLTKGDLPEDTLKAKVLRTKATRYVMIYGDLYRRGFSTPLLKCLTRDQAEYVIKQLHEEIYRMHSGSRTMATQVLRARYYWSTLRTNYAKYVKRCVQCQKHGNLIHQLANKLHILASPWPFAMWGMNLLGPFPPAKGQCKYWLVVIDYFIKCLEGEPLTTISANNVQKKLWSNVVTRFDIPHSDN